MKNNIIKYIRHDLRNGVLGQKGKFLVSAFIFVFLCGTLLRTVITIQNHPHSGFMPDPTLGDYLYQLLQGMSPFRPNSEDFEINVIWLLINLFLAYIVSFYPFKDLGGYGQLMLLRSQKRGHWWLGKCIWNIGCVTLYYGVMWAVAAVFALCTGTLSLVPTQAIQEVFSAGNVSALTPPRMLFHALLAPWLASVAISLLQMTVSLFTQPIIGIIAVCAVLVASIFTDSFLAPGNYLMLLRHGLPINWELGCLWLVLIAAASVVVGYFGFKTRDIFSIEK